MKYYVIAGEASGDLHAANLLKELKIIDSDARVRAWGGDRMIAEGAEVVKHIRDLAFMGFWEVIRNIRTIKKNIDWCRKDILEYQPDVLVLVDYPGFNLRIAEFAKSRGMKVVYYISPQVWAWKKNRVFTIKKVVDRMLVILPFEVGFYKEYNMPVDFVGHPLIDELSEFKSIGEDKHNNQPSIALLPGSRKQEISKILPEMMKVATDFKDYRFVIAAAPSLDLSIYESIKLQNNVEIVQGKTYEILASCEAALVTSGTATLEAAILDVPQVVCYKTSSFSYQLGKRLVKVPYISLVNLIMNRPIVTELVQQECNYRKMGQELRNILREENRRGLLEEYQLLRRKLGGKGASKKAADIVFETVKS